MVSSSGQTSPRNRLAEPKIDFTAEIDKLEEQLEDLRIRYEQYFAGVIPIAPEPLQNLIKNKLRNLQKAPFRTSQINFRLRGVESKYNSYNCYWRRVMREKESGTYCKDVFKANLRARIAAEEAKQNGSGGADKAMRQLFDTYKNALERVGSTKGDSLSFEAFRKSLIQRAKTLKEQHGVKKISFAVTVKDGKVSVQVKGSQ